MSDDLLQWLAESAKAGAALKASFNRARGARDAKQLLYHLALAHKRTEDERAFIDELLVTVAHGTDVRDVLEIESKKVGHRPTTDRNLAIAIAVAFDVRVRDGMTKSQAAIQIGKVLNKSPAAIKKLIQRGPTKD